MSSDGCAVFLYCLCLSDYQLWEVASENRWELISSSEYKFYRDDDDIEMRSLILSHTRFWFFLVGAQNSRRCLWVNNYVSLTLQMIRRMKTKFLSTNT